MNPEVIRMQNKVDAVGKLLSIVDRQSLEILARVVKLHEYLLGENIPQEVKADTPSPAGILESWTGQLQEIMGKLHMVIRHFDNLK